MKNPKARFAFSAVLVLIVLMAFLFGGSAITALAAQSALPGDALYPVKTTIEQTRLSLSRSADVRAQLQLEFAGRRLAEIESLIAEGRYQQVSTATVEYEAYIKNALAEVELISQGDPNHATELMLQISQSLSRYAQTLTLMMSTVPEPVKNEMIRSIESVQAVSGQENLLGETEFIGIIESMDGDTWVIGGRTFRIMALTELKDQVQVRDQVRVHAYQDADGQFRAREIERVRAGDENSNQNENGNGNGNENQNGNLNSNQNSNSNENLNQNQNQNQNQNGDDDGNGNMNQNQNGDDDDEGGNQNQNQNQNQNGDDDGNGNMNQNQNQNQNGDDDDDDGNENQNQNGDDDCDDCNQNQNQNHNGDDDHDDDHDGDNGNMNQNGDGDDGGSGNGNG